jgi:prevent-host-death family protein
VEVTLYSAKTHFSRLIERVRKGEEIVITRNGEPVARLVPAHAGRGKRKLGLLKGRIRVRDDFDAPLPEATLHEFEGQ